MGKYIDEEQLKAEIERFNSLVPYENNDRHDEGLHDAYKAVKNVIDSLQQEQQKDKQVVVITESHGNANIEWDCRSLDDVMALLKSAESFISDKQVEKLRGLGCGPDYDTVEGRYSKLLRYQQEQPEVDLEKEIEEHAIYMPHGEFASDNERLEDMEWVRKEFRYFYELGLNAQK